MKPAQELFNERLGRLSTAVALGKPDRVPVVAGVDAFAAHHMGITTAEYINDQDKASKILAESVAKLGDIDATLFITTFARMAGPGWLSEVKLPGRDLGPNEAFQVHELGLMTLEDYDTIINKGWSNFFMEFVNTRLPSNATADFQQYLGTDFAGAAANFINKGIVPFTTVMTGPALDILCAGRGMKNFTRDLFKMPDKVLAAMDVILAENIESYKNQIAAAKPFAVWFGATRSASEFLAPKTWQRFVWPYIKKAVEAIVDAGAYAYLHCDSNWDRDLEFFRELPKAKCIFGCDHATDIYKIKAVLGDHMCIFGDVPASLLAIGNPDEVYHYCTKLIQEIGPSGFILAAACNIPANAKVENVKAMVAAATGK
jgi:hypothetical protein